MHIYAMMGSDDYHFVWGDMSWIKGSPDYENIDFAWTLGFWPLHITTRHASVFIQLDIYAVCHTLSWVLVCPLIHDLLLTRGTWWLSLCLTGYVLDQRQPRKWNYRFCLNAWLLIPLLLQGILSITLAHSMISKPHNSTCAIDWCFRVTGNHLLLPTRLLWMSSSSPQVKACVDCLIAGLHRISRYPIHFRPGRPTDICWRPSC